MAFNQVLKTEARDGFGFASAIGLTTLRTEDDEEADDDATSCGDECFDVVVRGGLDVDNWKVDDDMLAANGARLQERTKQQRTRSKMALWAVSTSELLRGVRFTAVTRRRAQSPTADNQYTAVHR